MKINLMEYIQKMVDLGYGNQDATARVCQDVILKAISDSTFSRNVTIKGGVVMRSRTENIRRATQDMDIDFIKYSLNDAAIDTFVNKINCIEGLTIRRTGRIMELNQQDYKGKRIFIEISDTYGQSIESKIDLGVHNHFDISQEEYCFDIAFDDEGASLLINSKEQMVAEKIRSLLKFGRFSTRYKDIYDIFYYSDKVDMDNLKKCLNTYVINDSRMRENDMHSVYTRINNVFSDKTFRKKVDEYEKRWLDNDIDEIFVGILNFIRIAEKTE